MTNTLIKQIEEELAVFQDYSASLGFPMNQEAHEKGLKIATDKLIKAFTEAVDRAEPKEYPVPINNDWNAYNDAISTFKSNIKEEIGEL